jgi:hypothetical protein
MCKLGAGGENTGARAAAAATGAAASCIKDTGGAGAGRRAWNETPHQKQDMVNSDTPAWAGRRWRGGGLVRHAELPPFLEYFAPHTHLKLNVAKALPTRIAVQGAGDGPRVRRRRGARCGRWRRSKRSGRRSGRRRSG